MKTKLTRLTALFLATALLLLTFAGCSKEPREVETFEPSDGPGYADLVETDSLVVYIVSEFEATERRRIDQFASATDINVEVVSMSDDEYQERVVNDLVSGSGPDVIFLDSLYTLDAEKAAVNHYFLDLTNVLEEDPNFSEDNYMDGVFEAGQYQGRQYIIPISYVTPMTIASASRLQELGFRWDKIDTTSDYLEELAGQLQRAAENKEFFQMFISKNYFSKFFQSSGVRLIDYETGEVIPDEKVLKDFLEGYKSFFVYDYDGTGAVTSVSRGNEILSSGRCTFWIPKYMLGLIETLSLMKSDSVQYEIHPIPSQTNDVVGTISEQLAISANSPNSMNAYRFIKFMLSEEIQKDNFSLTGLPIHKEAVRNYLLEAPALIPNGSLYTFDYENNAFSEEEVESIIAQYTEIDRFLMLPDVHINMLFESMLPFFKAEDSYKNCLAELRSKLTFYLSE